MIPTALRMLFVCAWLGLMGWHIHAVVLPAWGMVRANDLTAVLSQHLDHSYRYRLLGGEDQVLGSMEVDFYLEETLIVCHQRLLIDDIGPFLKPAAGQLKNLSDEALPDGLPFGGEGSFDISMLLGFLIRGGLEIDSTMTFDDRARPVSFLSEGSLGSITGEAEISISPAGLHIVATGMERRFQRAWNDPDQNDIDSPLPILLLPPGLQPGDRYALRCLAPDYANQAPRVERYVLSVEAVEDMTDRVRAVLSAGGRVSATMIVDPDGIPQSVAFADAPFRLVLEEHVIHDYPALEEEEPSGD